MRTLCLVLITVFAATGCGKYLAPLPPEALAPRAVEGLEVTTTHEQVALIWVAPEEDRRGRELKSIDGYVIQRKEIVERGDETDPSIEYVELGFVQDLHVKIREDLRKEARAQGKIGRTIQAPDGLTSFSFLDSTAKNGKTYLYQVLPQNQGSVDGVIKQVAKVVFKGAESDVTILAVGDVESDDEPEDNGAVGRQ